MTNPHESLAHYRQYCADNGRKPRKVWGLYDPTGALKAWSTVKRDLQRQRDGLVQEPRGWEVKVCP